jgi:excisionase family DNA binding protein
MLGGIGRTNLYALLSQGKLESVKIGKRRLVRVSSIHALIADAADRCKANG